MIIKFDHISFVESRKEKEKILNGKGTPLFIEQSLKNLKSKERLMRGLHVDHDLYFYEGVFPIEYIFYDEISHHTNISLEGEVLYGHYNNKKNAIDFLKGIFGNKVIEDDDIIKCNMKGVLDKKDYMLILKKTEEGLDSYLDDGGFGVATLITNSLFSRKPIDGICTDYELLKVNNKDLEICFTKSNSTDIIFEIIKLKG